MHVIIPDGRISQRPLDRASTCCSRTANQFQYIDVVM